eukprot:349929-Chlamydomonas_euryale.AAC.4
MKAWEGRQQEWRQVGEELPWWWVPRCRHAGSVACGCSRGSTQACRREAKEAGCACVRSWEGWGLWGRGGRFQSSCVGWGWWGGDGRFHSSWVGWGWWGGDGRFHSSWLSQGHGLDDLG